MVTSISTERARSLHDAGMAFVDVLPPSSYVQEHIAGAVNLPLPDIGSAPERLDLTPPVVVDCYDHQ